MISKIHLKGLTVFVFLIGLLSFGLYSCGGSGGGGSNSTSNTGGSTTVSGVASKGPIKGGSVKVYKIVDGKKGDLLGSDNTSNTGSYSIDIGNYTGPVLIEVKGGSYKDEATGKNIDLMFSLRAAIGDVSGDTKVYVTPLTELAVRKAEPGGLTSGKIDASNKLISQLLGTDITKTLPVNVTDKDACDNATDSQKEYGLLLAALSQMSKNTSESIDDVIKEVENDLKDNKLDNTTREKLVTALDNVSKKTGINLGKLVEYIDNATTSGLKPTGSLGKAKELLADFLHNPTEDNYNNFMDYMNSFVDESKEAHLFKALATLFDIYNSQAVSFIEDKDGLDINFNTDFKKLNKKEVVYKFLKLTSYDNDIKGLLAEIETRLDQVDADLEQAEGVNTSVSLTGFDTVYFDDIDVKVLRTVDKTLKAVCVYLLSMDFDDVTNWNVTTAGGQVDIRDLIKNGDEITDDQVKEFLQNNPKLFTYSDTSKLAEFKTAFKEAKEQYSSAVKALDDLGESGRRLRYKNAFSLDTDLALWEAKAIEEKTLPSIENAFGDRNAKIIKILVVDNKESNEKCVDGKDGYYYLQETYNINFKSYKPAGNITIYDLISGTKSPRDVLNAAIANEDYKPYIPVSGTTEVYKENVAETDWEEPIDTYTVPLSDIKIDGNADDWDGITTFYDNGDTKIKIARDSEGNLYLYVSKPEGFSNERYYMSGNWESYFDIELSFRNGKLEAGYYDSNRNVVDTVKPIQSGDTVIGVEVKYPDAFKRLTNVGNVNHFEWWSYKSGSRWKEIKLLPEDSE